MCMCVCVWGGGGGRGSKPVCRAAQEFNVLLFQNVFPVHTGSLYLLIYFAMQGFGFE